MLTQFEDEIESHWIRLPQDVVPAFTIYRKRASTNEIFMHLQILVYSDDPLSACLLVMWLPRGGCSIFLIAETLLEYILCRTTSNKAVPSWAHRLPHTAQAPRFLVTPG
jgi:hypothetical protein